MNTNYCTFLQLSALQTIAHGEAARFDFVARGLIKMMSDGFLFPILTIENISIIPKPHSKISSIVMSSESIELQVDVS